MKYIKKYENISERFKVGDYVTCLRAENFFYLKKNNTYMVTSTDYDLITVTDGIGHTIDSLNRTRFRLATPEEIEKFTLNNDINKYNL